MVEPFRTVNIDIDRLIEFKTKTYDDHITYLWGGKDPNPGSGVIDFTEGIDCSGWFRTLAEYITHRTLLLPDGSWNQANYLMASNYKYHTIYSDQDYINAVSVNDNLMRVGFHHPNGRGGDSTGHVFPDVHRHTVESYGGHGPGERPIMHPWFVKHCDIVFVLGPMIVWPKP